MRSSKTLHTAVGTGTKSLPRRGKRSPCQSSPKASAKADDSSRQSAAGMWSAPTCRRFQKRGHLRARPPRRHRRQILQPETRLRRRCRPRNPPPCLCRKFQMRESDKLRQAQRRPSLLTCSSHKENRLPSQSSFAAAPGPQSLPATSNPWLSLAPAGSRKKRQSAVRGEPADNSTAFATPAATNRQAPEEQKQLCTQKTRPAAPAEHINGGAAIVEFSLTRQARFPKPDRP